MRLAVDTNRIIAALVKDSASRKILLSDKFDFLTIEITKQEIEEHRQELLDKTRLTDEQLNLALSLLFSRIFVVRLRLSNKRNDAGAYKTVTPFFHCVGLLDLPDNKQPLVVGEGGLVYRNTTTQYVTSYPHI